MTFGQLFNLSALACLICKMNSTYFKWLLGDLKEFNTREVFIIIVTTLVQTSSLIFYITVA